VKSFGSCTNQKDLENESDDDAGACIERDVCGSKRSSEEWSEAAFAPIAAGHPELPVIPEIDHETPAQIMAQAHNSTVGHSGVLVDVESCVESRQTMGIKSGNDRTNRPVYIGVLRMSEVP